MCVLYATPQITRTLGTQLKELDELRRRLGEGIGARGPWLGQLRRQVRTRAIESSVSIEGFSVPAGEAAALVAGDEPAPANDQDRLAISSYARAMDHVGIMASDPTFRWSERVILDLHFDACSFQRDAQPGLLRTGPIYVTSPGSGPPAYEGPPAVSVPDLFSETVGWLGSGDLDTHVVIRAAMAHLHVVSVHPFRDGNGRISRISQSLVLALDRLLSPEFNSIEEYLGRNTQRYYAVLRQVQAGSYGPERDAGPWVRFCVAAHIEQARQRLDQLARAATRWAAHERLVEARGWPDRLVIALEQSLFDGVERASYATEAGISLATATTDLRRLLDAGLVTQVGRTRSTRYVASDELRRATSGAGS
jgi:Fic family protein